MPFTRTHRARYKDVVALGVGIDENRCQDAYRCRPPKPQVYYDALLRLVNLVLPYAILCPRAVLCVLVRPCMSSCSFVRSCVIKFTVPQKSILSGMKISSNFLPRKRDRVPSNVSWPMAVDILRLLDVQD